MTDKPERDELRGATYEFWFKRAQELPWRLVGKRNWERALRELRQRDEEIERLRAIAYDAETANVGLATERDRLKARVAELEAQVKRTELAHWKELMR